jgi:hypothetical protein
MGSARTQVLIAVGVIAVVAFAGMITYFSIRHQIGKTSVAPTTTIAAVPEYTPTGPTTLAPTRPTTATTSTTPATDPRRALATHPLSVGALPMPAQLCVLPRFDPADAKQVEFFQAAKVCVDNAWAATLPVNGVAGPSVQVVMVVGAPVGTGCGVTVAPTAAPTHCLGTVYVTPAHLRDVAGLGRYPGRYLGVFLREYSHAVQDTTGITALVAAAGQTPGADPGDLRGRVDQQATCLAGIVSGAMSGQGAVDANITAEIADRLTGSDAPPEAKSWLDKGFRTRQPASCNSW